MNPWQEQHTQREAAFQDDSRVADRLVAMEYDDVPEAAACRCGGTLWWKATVGAFKCATCGVLCTEEGDYL